MPLSVISAVLLALMLAVAREPLAGGVDAEATLSADKAAKPIVTIQGKVVRIAAGNFWGIVGNDGTNYDPGTLVEAYQQPELQVWAEVILVPKRPARMWGKAITIVRIEKSALEHGAHVHHPLQEQGPGFQRSVHDYDIPDVAVVDAGGSLVRSANLFDSHKTVVVSFIFTSCTAVCPILTATLAQARQRLGNAAEDVLMVSISIDPEYDTPARLRDYARRFGAQGDWRFLTGERHDIRELQRAFDADRGDKNNHQPLALIRHAGQKPWMRLDGFTSAAELVGEIMRVSEAEVETKL